MMTALAKKLVRDLRRLVGQVVTIALVVACGISGYVSMQSAYDSLVRSRDAYYEAHRFPDVFVHLKRAPESIRARLEAIPGVALVETRLVESILLPVENMAEPAIGRVVSLPPGGEPALALPYLKAGRWPEPARADEVVVLDNFANAHRLAPGDRLPAVLNGVRRDLRIVGLALSPEYVYAVAEGGILGDDTRFAVLWMNRDVAAPSFRMEGAFDDAILRLEPGAREREITDAVDRVLAPYGGLGAHGRDRQQSNLMLSGELGQLANFATIVPAIFLAVAAFLLNVLLARIVLLQKPQIATLRALGYTGFEVALHYFQLVSVVVVLGAVIGVGLGGWLGSGMMELYRPFFRFPRLDYHLSFALAAKSVLVAVVAGFAGAVQTLRQVMKLPPAEAMRPDAPARYRPSLIERLGLGRLAGNAGRMILRELTRRPLRTSLSVLGIALSIAVVIGSRFGYDSIEVIREVDLVQAYQMTEIVAFRQPVPETVERELHQLPGVLHVELQRTVPVRIRSGARFRDVALTGHPPEPTMRRILEHPYRVAKIPEEGLMLSIALAEVLEVRPGDEVVLEVLEGDRPTLRVPVVAIAQESMGQNAHAALPWLYRVLGERDGVTQANLQVDTTQDAALDRRLKELPMVAAVMRPRSLLASFDRQTGGTMWVTTLILTLFGATISVGIVYNNARIALSTRSRDLATLRVLGFTRGEISAILLGEMAAYVALAIPVGLVLGNLLMQAVMQSSQTETFRFPSYVSPRSYAFATVVTLVAAVASGLLVRRRLDHLDLIGVLKARE